MGILSKIFGEKAICQHSSTTTSSPIFTTKPIPQEPKQRITVHIEPISPSQVEIPPLQGDYAKTIFLNAYSKASPIKQADNYQKYFLYECGIRNCPQYHQMLIDEGYLSVSTIEERIENLKVDEIKKILGEEGLPTSGKKAILVERLMSKVDEISVKKYLPDVTYSITQKGQDFINEHSAYILLHRHKEWEIGWREFDNRKQPGYRVNDILWGIFNERIITSKCFGRNEYFYMYQLLKEEGKRKNAVEMLLRVIYIDISGVEGLSYLNDSFWTIEDAHNGFTTAIMLAPGIINSLHEFYDVYTDAMVDRLYEWKLPVQICEKKMFLNMIHSIFNKSFDADLFLKNLRVVWDKLINEMRKTT